MKKNYIILLILIIFLLGCQQTAFQQKETPVKNKKFGFSMQEPKDWYIAENKELDSNLEKIDFSDEKFQALLKNDKGTLLLKAYYKYDPKTTAGVIPTVQVNIRKNDTKDFENFKQTVSKSAVDMKQYFEDFEFIEEIKEIEISGINSVFFIAKFSLKNQTGEVMKVKTRTYAIPVDEYFYQVNFSDGQQDEDSNKLFDELLKSIRINKE